MSPLLLAVSLLWGVAGGAPQAEPAPVSWDGAATRPYLDAAAGVRFPIPASGYLVESRHFERGTEPWRIKDSITVRVEGRETFRVDVFHDPERLGLARFFEAHLSYLQDEETDRVDGFAGVDGAPAILLEQPRSAQAFGQRIAVFTLGGRVFKLVCLDRDDVAALRLFERALASFEVQP